MQALSPQKMPKSGKLSFQPSGYLPGCALPGSDRLFQGAGALRYLRPDRFGLHAILGKRAGLAASMLDYLFGSYFFAQNQF